MSYDTASFARPMINPHARRRLLAGAATAALVWIATPATPAELQPRTIAAFGHYVQLSEATMNAGAMTRIDFIGGLLEVCRLFGRGRRGLAPHIGPMLTLT